MASLLYLPQTALLEISAYLDTTSRLALRFTNHELRLRIPKPEKCEVTMDELLLVEQWRHFTSADQTDVWHPNNYFGCCICLRLKEAKKFPSTQIIGVRGKAESSSTKELKEKRKRFCYDCEMLKRRMPPGTVYEHGEGGELRKLKCGKCQKHVELKVGEEIVPGKRTGLCQKCAAKNDFRKLFDGGEMGSLIAEQMEKGQEVLREKKEWERRERREREKKTQEEKRRIETEASTGPEA